MSLPSNTAGFANFLTKLTCDYVADEPDLTSEDRQTLLRVVAYQLITGERSVDPALAESYVLAAAAGWAASASKGVATHVEVREARELKPGDRVVAWENEHSQVVRVVLHADYSTPGSMAGVAMADVWFTDGMSETVKADAQLLVRA